MKKFSWIKNIDWSLRLLQLTIILIPFSYWPRIYLSSLQGLNLEFSLVQISAILFVFASIPSVFKYSSKLYALLPLKLLSAFVLFNWFSIIWSADATRTVVLSAYWTFLLALVISVTALFLSKKIKQKDITNPLIAGAAIGAFFGWAQYKGVAYGVGEEFTLIKHAYNAELFGFARIQAFALEPQFYASSLIAPIAYLSWRVLFSKYRNYHLVLLAWFFATFLLTVSRGGTLGLIAALGFMIFWFFKSGQKEQRQKLTNLVGVLVIGLIMSLTAVYVSGSMRPKHTGLGSVEIFVDQISHGVIDIKLANGGRGVDGLVKASTDGRFYMVNRALDIVAQAPQNYVIGIGAGSFGPVFQDTFAGVKLNNNVINNQYVEFFTELGIIGLALFLAFVTSFYKQVWQRTKSYNYLFVAILLAYLVQYLFFSLQTNVLHIWLFIGIALGVSINKKRAKA